ncbi:hypothetical protein GOODEAATRI_012675 [Goodea atripinnis]|uniref:Uncharacterized protein n=1 Tax=Goodea atripinnis TaxID=208336 RepID=A0ABV0N0V3_9TELE
MPLLKTNEPRKQEKPYYMPSALSKGIHQGDRQSKAFCCHKEDTEIDGRRTWLRIPQGQPTTWREERQTQRESSQWCRLSSVKKLLSCYTASPLQGCPLGL